MIPTSAPPSQGAPGFLEMPLQLHGPWCLKDVANSGKSVSGHGADTNELSSKPHISCLPKSVARTPVKMWTDLDSHFSSFPYSDDKSSVIPEALGY